MMKRVEVSVERYSWPMRDVEEVCKERHGSNPFGRNVCKKSMSNDLFCKCGVRAKVCKCIEPIVITGKKCKCGLDCGNCSWIYGATENFSGASAGIVIVTTSEYGKYVEEKYNKKYEDMVLLHNNLAILNGKDWPILLSVTYDDIFGNVLTPYRKKKLDAIMKLYYQKYYLMEDIELPSEHKDVSLIILRKLVRILETKYPWVVELISVLRGEFFGDNNAAFDLSLMMDDGPMLVTMWNILQKKDTAILLSLVLPSGGLCLRKNQFSSYSDATFFISAVGKCRVGENCKKAIIREISEELNLQVVASDIKPLNAFYNRKIEVFDNQWGRMSMFIYYAHKLNFN